MFNKNKSNLFISIFIFFLSINLYANINPQNDFGMNENWTIIRQGYEKQKGLTAFFDFKNEKEGVMLELLTEFGSKTSQNYKISITKDSGHHWDSLYNFTLFNKSTYSNISYKNDIIVIARIEFDTSKTFSDVWLSTDKGKSWNSIKVEHTETSINLEYVLPKIVIINDSTYIIKYREGIFRTNNRFKTIENISKNINMTGKIRINDIFLDDNNSKIYLLTADYSNEIKYSEDFGSSWKSIPNDSNLPYITRKFYFPNDTTCIIIGSLRNNDIQSFKDSMFVSKDSFKTWNKYDLDIPAHHYQSDFLDNDLYLAFSPLDIYKLENYEPLPKHIGGDVNLANIPIVFTDFAILGKSKLILIDQFYGNIWMYDTSITYINDIKLFQTEIFPNPVYANRKIYICLENDKYRIIKLKIYNISGKLIDESQEMNIHKGYHTIDYLPNFFTHGAYFILIESSGEIIARNKFIIK